MTTAPQKGRKLHRRENRRKSPGQETLQRQGESPKKRTEKGIERTENTKRSTRSSSASATRRQPASKREHQKTHRIVQRIDRVHESDDGVHQLSHEEQATGANQRAKRSSAATGPKSQPIFSATLARKGVERELENGLDHASEREREPAADGNQKNFSSENGNNAHSGPRVVRSRATWSAWRLCARAGAACHGRADQHQWRQPTGRRRPG